MHFAVYRTSGSRAGEIVRCGFATLDAGNQLMPGEAPAMSIVMAEVLDPAAQYVAAGAVVDRPVMSTSITKAQILADGADQSVISSIPAGAAVTIGEQSITPADGKVTLTSTIPGTYRIIVQHWPHLDFETSIEAT